MIEAFIRKNGVTQCPAPFTPEMRDLNIERQRSYEQQAAWNGGRRWRKAKRQDQ